MLHQYTYPQHVYTSKRQNEAQYHKFSKVLKKAIVRFVISYRYDQNDRLLATDVLKPSRLIVTTSRKYLRSLAFFIRNSTYCQAAILTDVIGADRLRAAKARFALQYQFLSDRFRKRISVELFSTETSSVPSIATPFFCGQRIFAAAA
jgi:NADH:ubiquinone oxidoreductase subunit C